MNTILNQKVILAITFMIALLAFGVFASNVYAVAPGAGDGGCCGGDDTPTTPTTPNTPDRPDTPDTPDTPTYPVVCHYLKANTTTVPYGGGNVTLSWNVQNANSASINNDVGAISVRSSTGSQTVFVNSNTNFVLTANGVGGSVSCAVSITVTPPPVTPAAKCLSFTADRTQVPYGGGTVNLSWATSNASSVNISGIGSGLAANKTGHGVTVNSNTTFTLTAVGAGGNDTHCKVTITVGNPPVTPAAKCDSFTASKYKVSKNGETITLTWNTTNATSVDISGVATGLSADSQRDVFVNSDRTFTLIAHGTNGDDSSCKVTISTETGHIETPSCNYLSADTDDFEEFGDRITLSWSTTNADQVTINPRPGRVSSSGDEEVAIYDERTTFTLTARNLQYNTEATCTVTIRVDEEEEDDEKSPRCELEVSDRKVNKGDRVTLSWDTQYTDEVVIRDDRGNTIFDTDDYSSSQRKRYLDGEIDVVINRSTEFTLNARGDGGSRSCEVEVETEDELAVYENRDQGYVIALTQVPYTGFEAGPFLTFLFYAVLTLWALFIAYVLVIKKSSILGFSLYGNTGNSATNEADIANRKKVEALVAKYSGQNQN